ncbi:hypothetical protein [Micromonospora zamorensis]|uniref:hypothetical protein n=1 Tax=Micromonospora zamorensis TaxID=709883 RepID=UPI003790BD76
MIPQPYPLWCAEASSDRHVSAGRIIGWIPTNEDDGDLPSGAPIDYLPVVHFADPLDGACDGIHSPVEYQQLFIGDDPMKVREQAEAWARRQPVPPAQRVEPPRFV